jgi:hypothetical protein
MQLETFENKRQRKSKGKSTMDNPEKLATLGTQDAKQKTKKDEQRELH